MRSSSTEDESLTAMADEEEDLGVRLVGDITLPAQLGYVKVEGVGLVTGLAGTGGDPPPSPLRSALIGEMQSHNVHQPEKLLASANNALVVVRGYLPPGVRKGERFDLEVVVPPGSEVTSLRNGYLMRARMREMRELGNVMRSGHIIALSEGNVLVESTFMSADDKFLETRGRILGGGVARVSRPLGLVLRPDDASTREASRIGAVINARFHRGRGAGKQGVAEPKRDNYVELQIPSRYKQNLARYIRVVRSIALNETAVQRAARIDLLERRLLERTSAARAALQLEAVGDDAIPALEKGLLSRETEVRFYAAEALAYLDQEQAAPVLREMAEQEPAFRWHALAALTAMDHVAAYEALSALLHVASAETRYGAFRALRTRNPADPLVKGESLGRDFSYHIVASSGPPMIHFARSQRPEVVLFGSQEFVEPPAFLFAGKQIMIKGLQDGRLKVSRFGLGTREDYQEVVAGTSDAMIRAITRLGGGYAEVLQATQEARQSGYSEAKVVVGALAHPGRRYRKDPELDGETPERPSFRAANPTPNMFADPLESKANRRARLPDEIAPEPVEEDESSPSFMGRMTGWLSR
jgi:hypothetical protein